MTGLKPKKTPWKRARTPDQQAQRRQEILEAACKLFGELDFEKVSLNAIAREAKLSKPSIYLYFQTREEVLMEIFFDVLRQWVDNSVAAFRALPNGATANQLADTWTNVFWTDQRFGVIAPLVAVSLEHNVSDDILAVCFRIKTEAAGRLRDVLARFVELSLEQSFELVVHALSLYAQYITYQHNEGMTRVLHRPEFNWIQCDYRTMVSHLLTLWIESKQPKQGNDHDV